VPNVRVLRQSFAGGEIAPELFGRIDLGKYASSVATMRNICALPHGPAVTRPGFRFVREVKTSANATRLLSFSFSNSQTFAIEIGAGYFRFHTLGATLSPGSPAAYSGGTAYAIGDMCTSGGVVYYCKAATTGNAPPNTTYWYAMPAGIYEIPNSYATADLFGIKYVQSGDVVTLTHPSYAPRELKRYSNTKWILATIAFASQTAAPASCTATATYPTAGTPKDFYYKVTALNSDGFEESPASPASAKIQNDLTITGNYNSITWASVAGASRYNVYKYSSGSYGYIGQVAATSLVDDNILADMTRTLPIANDPFTSANNYPTAVNYHEQRRFFAGTNNAPMNVWSTQSASDYNMSYTIPSQDSDALRFRLAAARANAIRHLVQLQDLIMLTASTEWRVFASQGNALTPSSLTIKAQSQNGASNVQPVVYNNYLLYEQAQGGHIREMTYQWQTSGYQSKDVSILAPHLFDDFTLVDMAFSRAPYPFLWCVSSSGKLLGLTHIPDQEVAGWHQHDTDGVFESCCTVTEGGEDALYVIVRRTINGATKRYIEKLDGWFTTAQADQFYVDCGLTYSGASTATITGLDHLEGKTVSILGDGAVMAPCVVTSGSITLEQPVTKAQIGLPIMADIKTLPTYFQDETLGQSRIKNVNKAWLRVFESGPFSAGPDENNLTPIKLRTFEPYGSPVALKTDEVELVVSGNWNAAGQLLIRQADPLPLKVIYIATEVAIGG
jgi:hypothetical protein